MRLKPGATIGIMGGGQLGWMLCLSAERLGFSTVVLDPSPDAPAGRVARGLITAAYDDPDALEQLADRADVVTFEFENVPATAVARLLELGARVAPGARALEVAQDRIVEKTFLNSLGIPTVVFAEINASGDIPAALQPVGAPALLKTRREGYDGKGQAWITQVAEAEAAFKAIGGKPAILEAKAPFVRELSIIAARGWDGALAAYPLGRNSHEHGILRRTLAPAPHAEAATQVAVGYVRTLMDALDYVGVIAVELFELADGCLLVNEIAPRVHNTGHWTLDGCEVDQFEQHIRAIAGWALGPTAAFGRYEMLNLIGPEAEAWEPLSTDPSARLWLYGKGDAREGRKMGHVNRRLE